MLKKLAILMTILATRLVFADGVQADLPFGLSQSQLTQLGDGVAWRRLLLADNATNQSEVRDDRFFVNQQNHGKPSRQATDELMAMLVAMERGDERVMCRFVARTHFLQQALWQFGKSHADFDLRHCAEFESWRQAMDIRQLSLVFAEESSENLASAFAHTLIRADRADLSADGAMAINYTVGSNADDAPLKSVAKSITGGYAGVLQITPFAQKSAEYLGQNRTLWQYRLRLTQDEIAQIVRHLWEIRQIKRPYFFTHDNCATEIVRLIDLVQTDGNVRAKIGKIVLPNEIVRTLVNENLSDNGTPITPKQQAVRAWANPVRSLPNYRADVGVAWQDGQATGVVGVRGAYHDQLDGAQGVRAYHDIDLLSVKLAVKQDQLAVNQATLFASQRLRGDGDDVKQSANAMHLGLISVVDASDQQNNRHLVLDASLAKGKSWQVLPMDSQRPAIGLVCYVLGGGAVQFGRINQGYRVGVTGDAGCVYGKPNWRGKVQLGVPYYFHHDDSPSRSHYAQPYAKVQMQYDIAKQMAIRLDGRVDFGFGDDKQRYALSLVNYF